MSIFNRKLLALPDAHLRRFERPPVPKRIESVHLIGICGTGMGALAGLLHMAGYRVRGSDETCYPPMSTRIAEMGVTLLEGFDPKHLDPAPDLVVVGNACTPTHPEAAYARERGMPQLSLPEAIAHFFLEGRRPLVVAGTHGKTTTTGMLVHVLRSAGLDPGFLVGGVLGDGSAGFGLGTGPHFAIEGDEYDSAYFDKRPKMLHYRPYSAVVTSMEFDHADVFDSWEEYREAFRAFAGLLPEDGLLVLGGDDPEVRTLASHTRARVRFAGLGDADVTARDVQLGGAPRGPGQSFTLVVDGDAVARIFLPMSGRHNVQNALAVCALALEAGVSVEQLARGLATFPGMRRRQEILGESGGVIVVDDFAHHPTAVRETIRAVSERWPDRRIVAVFEPRSNSSRRKVFEEPYARAFEGAGCVFLSAPPFRHNDQVETFLDAGRLVERIRSHGIPAATHPNAEALLPSLLAELRPSDVALIMSNGSFGGLHDRVLSALATRSERVGG